MRVRVLTNIPTPYNDALFAALAARPGVDLKVAYCAERESNRSWVLPADKPYAYAVLPGWTIRGSLHVNPGIARWLDEERPDVAIVSGGYTVPTLQAAAWLLHRRRIPWVFWGEELGDEALGDVRDRLRAVLRAVVRRAHRVLAIGERASRSYERLGVPASQIDDFHYYPDVEAFRLSPAARANARAAVRQEWAVGDDTTVFAFCGQLIDRKGVDTLIEARSRMRVEAAQCVVVLIGDGPERDRYEDMARALGVGDAIRFAGFAQPSLLPSCFAAADALVIPSRREGWGLVVGEAMAARLPVIASDAVNAGRDLIGLGQGGILVPAGDADALAVAMSRLHGDSELRAAMADRASATADHESPIRAAERLEAILRRVLGAPLVSRRSRNVAEVA